MSTASETIEELSAELFKSGAFHSSEDMLPFINRIKAVNFSDFLVHCFFTHHGTWLQSLLLATFECWKNFGINEWNAIFDRLRGYGLGEYYMKVIADSVLGIDPGFQSTKGLQIGAITLPDNVIHNASTFMPNASGRLKEMHERRLKDYGLSFDDLIEVNSRLTR